MTKQQIETRLNEIGRELNAYSLDLLKFIKEQKYSLLNDGLLDLYIVLWGCSRGVNNAHELIDYNALNELRQLYKQYTELN
jgi:hypothetical protein